MLPTCCGLSGSDGWPLPRYYSGLQAAETEQPHVGRDVVPDASQLGNGNRGRIPAITCDVDGALCHVRSHQHAERPQSVQRFGANCALFHSLSADSAASPM